LEDATALEENINFYSVRPLYIVGLRILKDYLTIPYARGTYIISSIFAALSVLTLHFIFCPMNYVQIALFPAIIDNRLCWSSKVIDTRCFSHFFGSLRPLSHHYVCARDFLDSAFFIPLAATCLLTIKHYSTSTARAQIFVISVAFFLLHLLVFPSYDPRFFLWCIGITSMFLFEQVSVQALPKTLS
jgi:hypothetical protein